LLALLCVRLARLRGNRNADDLTRNLVGGIEQLSVSLNRNLITLREKEKVFDYEIFLQTHRVLFIGSGIHYASALEASQKFKEVTRIASEGFPVGELKHGHLALVDERTPVVVFLSRDRSFSKTFNAIKIIESLKAPLFIVGDEVSHGELRASGIRAKSLFDMNYSAPHKYLQPIIEILPAQLLAFRVAMQKGLDPDKPVNLAKAVTV